MIRAIGTARISVLGTNNLGGQQWEGSGGGAPPPDAGKFSNIFKQFIQKIAKNALFQAIFQKKLKNPACFFGAFGRKIRIVERIVRVRLHSQRLNDMFVIIYLQ